MASHFDLLTRKFLKKFFFWVTNSTSWNIKLNFELLTWRFNLMGALLFSHYRVTNVKLINEKNSLNITFQNDMDCIILLRLFFVFSLLCCKYICDISLSNLDFNGLCSGKNGWFNNIFIYKITEDIQ